MRVHFAGLVYKKGGTLTKVMIAENNNGGGTKASLEAQLTAALEQARYANKKLSHAIQSGVAAKQAYSDECTPKHLRTGINVAMCETGALAHLLIVKGVFSELEWLSTVNAFLLNEVKMYEQELSALTKTKITLI